VAGKRLEIGDDEGNLPLFDESFQAREALRCVADGEQVLRNGFLVANTVVHISEAEAVDFRDLKRLAEIAQPPVKRRDVNRMSLSDKMIEAFAGAGGMSGAFAIHAVKNVGHLMVRV